LRHDPSVQEISKDSLDDCPAAVEERTAKTKPARMNKTAANRKRD
jgi:hypothetical protein